MLPASNCQLSVVVSQLPFILLIRGHKVMLSIELANLYQVEPRALIQAIKRNLNRFPSDFMFQLMAEEWENLKSQFVISSRGGVRTPPYAFTEQGVAMLSSVLNSDRAVQGQHRDHARLRAVAAVAGVQRCPRAQAGNAGEEIRRAVQGCVRRHPAVNVTASQAETGNRFPCEI